MPDSLLKNIDPGTAPFLIGMAIKARGFVITKGMTIVITFAFSVGIFYSQTTSMAASMDKLATRMEAMEATMVSMQLAHAITNTNIAHMTKNIEGITAQVGEITSYNVKIRE